MTLLDLHALDAAASGLIQLTELKADLGASSEKQAESWNDISKCMQSTVLSLRDQDRLLSSAFSVPERERQEAVMKAIHPHYSMPPPQHKAPLLKLLPQDMLDAAEKHDQSTFFARQGHSQQQLRQTSGSGISESHSQKGSSGSGWWFGFWCSDPASRTTISGSASGDPPECQ